MKKDYSESIIKAVKSGINSAFWTRGIKKILEEEIESLNEKILEDSGGERLSDTSRNQFIDLRLIIKNLLRDIEEIVNSPKEEKMEKEEPGFLHKEYE